MIACTVTVNDEHDFRSGPPSSKTTTLYKIIDSASSKKHTRESHLKKQAARYVSNDFEGS